MYWSAGILDIVTRLQTSILWNLWRMCGKKNGDPMSPKLRGYLKKGALLALLRFRLGKGASYLSYNRLGTQKLSNGDTLIYLRYFDSITAKVLGTIIDPISAVSDP